MNVAQAINFSGKRLLPEGISDQVTPGISSLGKFSIGQHPEFFCKKQGRGKSNESLGDVSSENSDDSIGKSILKIQRIGVKKYAQLTKQSEAQVLRMKNQFEHKFYGSNNKGGVSELDQNQKGTGFKEHIEH